jgi:hypothetical protein
VTLIATCSRQYFDHRLLAGACKSLLSIEFPGKATLESDRKENRLIFLRMRVFGGHNARLRTSGNRSDTNQRGERMSEWLRPILGAALLLAGAAGLAYKVISGYQHASPDAFISVHNQNRLPAASAVDHPTQATTVSVNGRS